MNFAHAPFPISRIRFVTTAIVVLLAVKDSSHTPLSRSKKSQMFSHIFFGLYSAFFRSYLSLARKGRRTPIRMNTRTIPSCENPLPSIRSTFDGSDVSLDDAAGDAGACDDDGGGVVILCWALSESSVTELLSRMVIRPIDVNT